MSLNRGTIAHCPQRSLDGASGTSRDHTQGDSRGLQLLGKPPFTPGLSWDTSLQSESRGEAGTGKLRPAPSSLHEPQGSTYFYIPSARISKNAPPCSAASVCSGDQTQVPVLTQQDFY